MDHGLSSPPEVSAFPDAAAAYQRYVGRTVMASADNEFIVALSEILVPVGEASFVRLSPPEKVFVLVWGLEADLNNGGFHQYFFNSHSDHAAAAPDALRAIGAPKTAAIVERAIEIFPNGAPTDRCTRQELLEELDPENEVFEGLDEEFLAYPHDLTTLLAAFARANRGSIRGA